MLNKTLKDLLIIVSAVISITLLVWLPYFLRLSVFGLDFSEGFNTILRNYDGIEYVIIAKTFYEPSLIALLPQSLPDTYYAAHFPGFSLLIALFAPLLGFLKSMLFVSLTFTALSAITFYFLVKNNRFTTQPLLLSLIFLILPARWVVVHSVGSSEPVFIFFVIAAFYFFLRFEKLHNPFDIFLTAVFGSLAQITRPPGALLFIAFGIYILWRIYQQKNIQFVKRLSLTLWTYYPLILMPLSLLAVFFWYHLSYNDFFAYFHSGDNIHLTLPPFQIFNKFQPWVGDIWLEEIVFIYIIGFFAGITLLKNKLYLMGIFVLTFMGAATLIAHRDISRYILPIFPFVLIAYQKVLTSPEFRWVLGITILAIYLYSQNFILNNTAPFPNLESFD